MERVDSVFLPTRHSTHSPCSFQFASETFTARDNKFIYSLSLKGIPGVRQRHREGDEIGTVNVILVVILPVLQMILVLLVIALLRICYVKYLKTKNEDEKIEPKLIQVVVSAQDMEKKKKLSIENNLG